MKDNKIREAFSKIHAPEGVLREVNMRINENESKKIFEKPRRYSKIVLIAAVLAAILAVSVAAYGFIHSDFYKNAFGTGVEGSPGGPKDEYDRDGNLVKTVDFPAVERVDVDPELAEKLVGGKVATAGETVNVGEYTVTVDDYVFDENGIGIVSAVISHPEGHTKYNNEWFLNTDNAFCDFDNFVYAGDKKLDFTSFGFKGKVAEEDSTETEFHVIYYVCQMLAEQETNDIDYVYSVPTPLAQSLTKDQVNSGELSYHGDELYDSVKIRIHIDDRVTSTEFVCGQDKISISPLGAKLPLGRIEHILENGEIWYESKVANTFVINFKDGSEYIVNDQKHTSTGEGTLDDADGGVSRIAFNRLVDVENIESIYITTQDGVERIYTAG